MTKLDAILAAQSTTTDPVAVLTEIEAEEGHTRSLHLTPSNGNMKTGWMWYDKDPGRSIEEKITRATARYLAKFGRSPNTCYVNHLAVNGDGFTVGKVKVLAASNILPHHFWLGVKA